MKGYGFGIWIVPNQQIFHPETRHIPHITIMCNVLDKNELKEIYDDIENKLGNTFVVNLDGKCVEFDSHYDNDPLVATGYNCSCDKWELLKEICKKYNGSFSNDPHLSYYYSENSKDLKFKKTLSREIICKLKMADINSNDCINWRIL